LNIFILFKFERNGKNQFILNSIRFFKEKIRIYNEIKKTNHFYTQKDLLHEKKIVNLIKILNRYLSGEKIELYKEIINLHIDLPIQTEFKTEFSKKVINWLLNNVKYGQITTYSEIGENINSKAYRAIGNILKRNPFPLIIPCHRVIRKNRNLGGFMGKNQESWQKDIKRKLLKLEGNSF